MNYAERRLLLVTAKLMRRMVNSVFLGTELRNMALEQIEDAIADVERYEEHKRKVIDLALHPSGKCTCAGEGICGWCTTTCPTCGVKNIEHGVECDQED